MSNTRRLVETQLKLNNDLTSFHTEFVKIAHLKADDQKELESLDPQFSQLENTIRQCVSRTRVTVYFLLMLRALESILSWVWVVIDDGILLNDYLRMGRWQSPM